MFYSFHDDDRHDDLDTCLSAERDDADPFPSDDALLAEIGLQPHVIRQLLSAASGAAG